MTKPNTHIASGPVVEEETHLTLVELCQACGAPEEHVTTWVFEGVLEPSGEAPKEWRFTGQSLRRAQLALWLMRDMEVNLSGIALALELFDKISELQTRLERVGIR
jgi:chaperone modulatory protein CbpM